MPRFVDVTDPAVAREVLGVDDVVESRDTMFQLFPGMADYIILNYDTTCGAVNTATGEVEIVVSDADHTPVFQHAMDQLKALDGPTRARGGKVGFIGRPVLSSQLVVPSGIELGGLVGWGTEGQVLESDYDGSIILVTEDAQGENNNTVFRNFRLAGDLAYTSQCGFEFNDSGGSNMRDVIMDEVFVDHVGQHALKLRSGVTTSGCKIWMYGCELEFNGGDAINAEGDLGTRLIVNGSYIIGNDGWGFNGAAYENITFTGGTIFGSNDLGNIKVTGSARGNLTVSNCFLASAGLGALPQIKYDGGGITGTRSTVNIVGNTFREDTTPGTGIVNHIIFGSTAGASVANVVGNSFKGHSGDAVKWTAYSSNQLNIKDNLGFNDVKGKLSTPFASGRIGAGGSGSSPSASTTYKAEGTDLMVVSTGGTGTSITITDPVGNTVASGLSSYSGVLPVNYSINWGPLTAWPTIYVGVL